MIDSARAKVPASEAEPVLLPYKDAVLGLYIVGLKSSSQQSAALSGLKAMVLSEGLLTDEELGFIVHNVNDIVEQDQDDTEDTRLIYLNHSSQILTLFPQRGDSGVIESHR